MRESEFGLEIRKWALPLGWHYYHTYNSRCSDIGFPDTVLVKDDLAIFAELKQKFRKPTPEQIAWLEALAKVKRTECYIWRPDDMEEIINRLE